MRRGHTYSRRSRLSAVLFSDLSKSKLRPAVVLADAGRNDWILCQITSSPYSDARAIQHQKEKLTLGQASKLAQMSQLQFQLLLASRQIPLHYDVAEFEADLRTLRDMGRL